MSESNETENDMKRKVDELKERNEILGLALQRSRHSVKRLKLEYGVLLERLESRVGLNPELHYEDPLPSLESFRKELLSKPLKRSKPKRQRTKERDPNMPKRPTNAYLIYCEMNKEKIRETGSQDVTRDLTEGWKSLSEEDRMPYYELYNEDRDRYHTEMQAYNKNIEKKKNDVEVSKDEVALKEEEHEEDEDEEEEEEDDEEEEEEGDEEEDEEEEEEEGHANEQEAELEMTESHKTKDKTETPALN